VSDFTQLLLAAVALLLAGGAAAVWLVVGGHVEVKMRRRPEPRKAAPANQEAGRI
jgi:hypothetical protein